MTPRDPDPALAAGDRRVLDGLGARGLLPLLRAVCAARGVTEVEIAGRTRTRAIAHARHELWWRIRSEPSLHFSYLEIARLFGCDHSTVIHGIRAHQRTLSP